MFDPTVYENLKVVLEGAVYDLDLDGVIEVTDRKDLVNLAGLERQYELSFTKRHVSSPTATINIRALFNDFAAEMLEKNQAAGCQLAISFDLKIADPSVCEKIEEALFQVWGDGPQITQELTCTYPDLEKYNNHIVIAFARKITEDQIDDFPDLLEHVVYSLAQIEGLAL